MGNRMMHFSTFLGKIHKRSVTNSRQNLFQEESDSISVQITMAHSSGEHLFNDNMFNTISSSPDLTCKVADTSLSLENPSSFSSSFQKIQPQPTNRNKNMLLTTFPNIPAPPRMTRRKGKAVDALSHRHQEESVQPPTPHLSTGRDQQTLQIWSQTRSVPPFSSREDKLSGQRPHPIRMQQEWSPGSFQNGPFLHLTNIAEEAPQLTEQPSNEGESIFSPTFFTILPAKHLNMEVESSPTIYNTPSPLPSNELELIPQSLQTIITFQSSSQNLEVELSPPSSLNSKLDTSKQSSIHFEAPVVFTTSKQSSQTFPSDLTRRKQESFQNITDLISGDKELIQISLSTAVSNKELLLKTIPTKGFPMKESLQTNPATPISNREKEVLQTITSSPVIIQKQELLQNIPTQAPHSREQKSVKPTLPSPIHGRKQESMQTLPPLVSSQEQELLPIIPSRTVYIKKQELLPEASQSIQSSYLVGQENLLHSWGLNNIIPPELTSKEEKHPTKTLHLTGELEELSSITLHNMVESPTEGRSPPGSQRGLFHCKGKEEERKPLEQLQPILKGERTLVNVCAGQITPILTNLAESASKMSETLAVLSEHQANIASNLKVLTSCQTL
ncbi:probable inactive serine/threonine-protein kinase DDB_G0278909 isoform X2 [Narcine bancroftii]|uniref:probable inactive serine/threonine-protein kinase DDB_G0278909 isoform X2 n=1 Tax=Narcine bancroftii TaxID=1343680 RepID=UPI003831EDB6